MKAIVAAVALAAGVAGSARAQTVTSTADERTALAVTVYNDGRGLVREERTVTLPAGVSEVRFVDVAEKVEPSSVRTAVTDGAAVRVLEQNYEYDLLSPQKMLDKFLGRSLTLVRTRTRDNATYDEEVRAKLLSTTSGTVWEVDGNIVTNPSYDRLVFPNVPDNLVARPTLAWLVEATGVGARRLETAYLTQGMTWRADYILSLDAAETKAGLAGWVTIDNQSGAAYDKATLKLVAGDVQRASSSAVPVYSAAKTRAGEPDLAAEALFEYHLYALPRPTTLKDRQTKQVRLLDVSGGIGIAKEYRLEAASAYHERWNATQKEKVAVVLRLRNDAASGLGSPLPGGVIRVYKRDSGGNAQLVGEDRVEHTPRDEELVVTAGNAFDISAERTQTDFKKLSDTVMESAYEIRVRNHKSEAVSVRVIETLGGDWSILESSLPHKKAAAFAAEFVMPVAARQEAVLTYRARVSY